jgi:hypothetical protein
MGFGDLDAGSVCVENDLGGSKRKRPEQSMDQDLFGPF